MSKHISQEQKNAKILAAINEFRDVESMAFHFKHLTLMYGAYIRSESASCTQTRQDVNYSYETFMYLFTEFLKIDDKYPIKD